jgi:hypothetical protein
MGEKLKTKAANVKRRSGNHPNPSHNKGDRNIFCPHYCNCLDFAINKAWDSWACFECRLKENKQFVEEFPYTNNDSVLYYPLPHDIYMKVG